MLIIYVNAHIQFCESVHFINLISTATYFTKTFIITITLFPEVSTLNFDLISQFLIYSYYNLR